MGAMGITGAAGASDAGARNVGWSGGGAHGSGGTGGVGGLGGTGGGRGGSTRRGGRLWDPFGTLHGALWIGGGQWAGKSTVAQILAYRYGLTAYHYDYHDARAHEDRRIARDVRLGRPTPEVRDPDETWVKPPPEEMAARTLVAFPERFTWALDDLRALVSGRPVLAEGWGLRPELVAPLLSSPRRMVVMVPTEEFRARQVRRLPRARKVHQRVSDPERAQANRLERDRLVAQDAVLKAEELGIMVIRVDGSLNAAQVADVVASQFRPFLTFDGQSF
jgi:hypothetical protein